MAAVTPGLQVHIPRIPSGLPETSPFKRVLQESVKGAITDSQSFPSLPDEYILYFCCVLPAYRRQQIICALQDELRSQTERLRRECTEAEALFSALGPIYRLPVELLSEMFRIAVQEGSHSPANLMRVSRLWHGVAIGLAPLWSKLKLRKFTESGRVERWLERTGRWPLQVEIDLAGDLRGTHWADGSSNTLSITFKHAHRWRTLRLVSLPTEADSTLRSLRLVQRLTHLESLCVESTCRIDHTNARLLEDICLNVTPRLTTMTLHSPSAIVFIAPLRLQFFSLTTLRVSVDRMETPVGILPYFHRLEVLDVRRLCLPEYPLGLDLPLVHTLRSLRLHGVSIQWMVGRQFDRLQHCSIISPQTRDISLNSPPTQLPVCTTLTYDGGPTEVLRQFDIPTINTMVLRSNVWNKFRGDMYLHPLWGGARLTGILRPRVLRLDVQCSDRALIYILQQNRHLEELELYLPRPSSLGRLFFGSLIARPMLVNGVMDWMIDEVYDSREGKETEWEVSLCPSLKVLRLQYQRWLRSSECDEIIPTLMAVAWSRERSAQPLQALLICWNGCTEAAELTRYASIGVRRVLNLPNPPSMVVLTALIRSALEKSIEIYSFDALHHIMQAPYRLVLRRLRVLKVHIPFSDTPLDILSCLERLEEFKARRLVLPTYTDGMDLPLVRTLRKLSIKFMSIQWMYGRRFRRLETCSIWHPDRENAPRVPRIDAPVCTRMKFIAAHMQTLGSFNLPRLQTMVTQTPFFPETWISGLASLWGINGGSTAMPKPRSLHMRIVVCNPAVRKALGFMPELEALVLEFLTPDGMERTLLEELTPLETNFISVSHDTELSPVSADNFSGRPLGTVVPQSCLCPRLKCLELRFWHPYSIQERESVELLCGRMIEARATNGAPLEIRIQWNFKSEVKQMVELV
jgi:hypothetical protein